MILSYNSPRILGEKVMVRIVKKCRSNINKENKWNPGDFSVMYILTDMSDCQWFNLSLMAAGGTRRVSKQGKRGVTFKIMDREQEVYDGPLMTLDEVYNRAMTHFPPKNYTNQGFGNLFLQTVLSPGAASRRRCQLSKWLCKLWLTKFSFFTWKVIKNRFISCVVILSLYQDLWKKRVFMRNHITPKVKVLLNHGDFIRDFCALNSQHTEYIMDFEMIT